MDKFKLVSEYKPTGDQPEAIAKLVDGLKNGYHEQSLLGVTGSGKTFTMANVIAQMNKPTLVLAHNKVLAAQLCNEFREFFPENAVEFFVSYYDYYQPESYIPTTDTYIEKDSSINDEIDRLRHSATSALSERRDVIIVASVSCIYSMGDPIDYRNMVLSLRPGMEKSRDEVIKKLAEISPDTRIYSNLSPSMLNYHCTDEPDAVIGNDAMYYHKGVPGIGFQEEAQPFGYRGVMLLFAQLDAAMQGAE